METMSECVIRQAATGDAAAIEKLNRDVMGYDYPLPQVRLEEILHKPGHVLLVAQIGDAVAGYAHAEEYCLTYAPPYLNLLALAVHEQYQRQGIGKKLLQAIEQYAQDIGATGMRILSGNSRMAAHALYRGSGYSETTKHRFLKDY